MVLEIRLTPRDGVLTIEPRDGVLTIDVKGNLAAMLAKASPTEDWDRQLAMVAGARNRHYRLASTWSPHERRHFLTERSSS